MVLFLFPLQRLMQVCGAFAEQPKEAVKSRTAVFGDKGVERIERGSALQSLADGRAFHAVGSAIASTCGSHKN